MYYKYTIRRFLMSQQQQTSYKTRCHTFKRQSTNDQTKQDSPLILPNTINTRI